MVPSLKREPWNHPDVTPTTQVSKIEDLGTAREPFSKSSRIQPAVIEGSGRILPATVQKNSRTVIDRTAGWAAAVRQAFRPFTPEEKNVVYDVLLKATGIEGDQLREHAVVLGALPKKTARVLFDSQDVANHIWPCLRKQMANPEIMARLTAIGIDGLNYHIAGKGRR
jgi:hypothetical protein